MQIELNEYNISEDWGWFVDTETLLLINQSKNKYNNINKYKNINKLEKITDEDEEYYDDIESLKKTEFLLINIGTLMEPCTTIIIVTTLTYLLLSIS